MPRIARMIVSDQTCIYHVISRTALNDFPFEKVEKDQMVQIIKRFSALYFTEVLGFCIMGNHFHLLIKMIPDHYYTDEEIMKRYEQFLAKPDKKKKGDDTISPNDNKHPISLEQLPYLRTKLASLSEYMKDIKQTCSRF